MEVPIYFTNIIINRHIIYRVMLRWCLSVVCCLSETRVYCEKTAPDSDLDTMVTVYSYFCACFRLLNDLLYVERNVKPY